jgi:hypothetical protein
MQFRLHRPWEHDAERETTAVEHMAIMSALGRRLPQSPAQRSHPVRTFCRLSPTAQMLHLFRLLYESSQAKPQVAAAPGALGSHPRLLDQCPCVLSMSDPHGS